MKLYFITGNRNKFAEAQAVIPEVEQLDIDLPEIQDIDATVIIKAKLHEAFKHHDGPFMVEDTSLYVDGLKGLPGPLIKWFLKTVGTEGLHQLAQSSGNTKASAKTIIGYAQDKYNIHLFEGSIVGEVVAPSGESGFGWDPIFKPDGQAQTFAQMGSEEKNKLSMRRMALEKLKNHLNT